jgi:hypothetical protein
MYGESRVMYKCCKTASEILTDCIQARHEQNSFKRNLINLSHFLPLFCIVGRGLSERFVINVDKFREAVIGLIAFILLSVHHGLELNKNY